MSAPVIGVVPILGFTSAAGCNSALEVSVLPEVDPLAFVVDRSQPALVFCDPVNAADTRGIVSFTTRVPSVFGLCHRPQILDTVVVSDAIDVVDEVRVYAVDELPDHAVGYPDRAFGSDADVTFGVDAACGSIPEDFVPRYVVRTRIPEQLSRRSVVAEKLCEFGLWGKLVGGHSAAPCDVGTSVIDQMEKVKEQVWH